MTQDEQQLNLLSIFHFVVGGIAGLISLLPTFHLAIGIALLNAPPRSSGHDNDIGSLVAIMFIVIASIFILAGLTFSTCIWISGRCLAQRRHHTYCLVMAGVECMFFPFGTALGVFTILVLMRESVKQMFGVGTTPGPSAPPYHPQGPAAPPNPSVGAGARE